MKKIRILVANEPEMPDGVTCWRMFWPLQLLERTYHDTLEVVYNRGNLFPSDFYQADVVLCYRPSAPHHLAVMQQAKKLGCKVLLDYDDDFLSISVGHPAYWELGTKRHVIEAAMQMADAVWVSTAALGKVYGHPNTTVVPNAVWPEAIAPKPADFKNKTVVWGGAVAHRDDADTFKNDYKALLRQIQRFVWVNYTPTWVTTIQSQAQVDHCPWIDTESYFDWLQQNGVVAIWKPLISNDFNKSKSNIAWITATLIGGVCVTNQAGNVQWENAVRELPKTEKEFARVWEASAERVRKEYDLRAWNDVRYREILKLVNG